MKIKDTLNLPQTEFPMRGGLPTKEPKILGRWEDLQLDEQIEAARAEAPLFILHDGPPYANGHLHLGHALNKILKDVVVRYRTVAGYHAPYVPGWDCHGMPIEHQVIRDMGAEALTADVIDIRQRCRESAAHWVEVQSREFRRLGSMGRYDTPYLTMTHAYEADVLRTFRDLVAAGYIGKGLRSIHWCLSCRTALAEAELEYAPHRSPSIYVAFPLVPDNKAAKRLSGLLPQGSTLHEVDLLIWTTTPWTIPANLAIALNHDLEYVLVRLEAEGSRVLLMAAELVDEALQNAGYGEVPRTVSPPIRGADLKGLTYNHPLYDRTSPVILADHVTLEHGTGCVHTAPGHGHEDFEVGRQYGLDVLCPVDEGGLFTEEAGTFAGQQVFETNRPIVEALRQAGVLLADVDVEHSYPHCWRCETPLIYRATEQWFLFVNANGLRERLLDAVGESSWFPSWGGDRMRSMLETRPDWCLSRQRSWGVPIPALYCADCGELHLNVTVIDRAAEIVEAEGSDAWFARPPADFTPDGMTCGHCDGHRFTRETDIFDVWFESGVSHRSVLESGAWPNLRWPSELYLEGHDQHRGWFQVSLITSIATRDRAPYGAVLTHGHVLDEQGRKMSKSVGNIITPQQIVDTYGADILRLYLLSVDYTRDLPFSQSLIEPVVEIYRKIRNTIRFLLGNLSDFEPSCAVNDENLLLIDRWILHRAAHLGKELHRDHESYQFHRVVQRLHQFCGVTLSAVYLSIIKDRMYCSAPNDDGRRAGQTTAWILADALTRWLAPLLPFTAEEIWEYLPGKREASVHLSTFLDLSSYPLENPEHEELELLMSVREHVLTALERAREVGIVKDSLEGRVVLWAEDAELEVLLRAQAGWLADLFIVSEVEIATGDEPLSAELVADAHADEILRIGIDRAAGEKCTRCWMHRTSVGTHATNPMLCDRCFDVLEQVR